MRAVAPAGAPIPLRAFVRAVRTVVRSGDAVSELETLVARRFQCGQCFAVGSGRAALTVLLRALRKLAPATRDEVIVPAYTCYSVPAAAVRAGLRIRVVDVRPETLDFHADALDRTPSDRVLAVIATNLYGLPNDMDRLSAWARRRGAYLIDDAAQSMAATSGGRYSGTWGDGGVFSLDKGKAISAIEGGFITTGSAAVAEAVGAELRTVGGAGAGHTLGWAAKVVAYGMFLNPRLYWIPNGIPQLGLGQTVYSTDFDVHRMSRPLAALALAVMSGLEAMTSRRRRIAGTYREMLAGGNLLTPIVPRGDAVPTYVRAPFLARDAASRSCIVNELIRAGIGATASYPSAILDVPGLQPFLAQRDASVSGGREIARRIVTLPTHDYVEHGDVARIESVLADISGRGQGALRCPASA